MKAVLRVWLVCCLLFGVKANAAKYYWVNGSGDWVQASTHWATTSGGQVYYLVPPSANDTVYFDINSFTSPGQQITLDSSSAYYCHTMVWDANVQYTPEFITHITFNTRLVLNGSLDIRTSNMIWSYFGELSFESNNPGNVIRSGGYTIGRVHFNSTGSGEWAMQDSLVTGELHMHGGKLFTNDHNLYVSTVFKTVASSNVREIYFGRSLVKCFNSGIDFEHPILADGDSAIFDMHSLTNIFGPGNTYGEVRLNNPWYVAPINAWNCTFNQLSNVSANAVNTNYDVALIGHGNTFHKIDAMGKVQVASVSSTVGFAKFSNNVEITSSLLVDTLYLNNQGSTVLLKADSVLTITGTILTDSYTGCNMYITVRSEISGVAARIYKSSGTVSCNSLSLEDINAYGGATFIANNSEIVANVLGWNSTPALSRDFYWIGGSGFWKDPNHWSFSSNGPSANCIPSKIDNVFFDAGSFSANGQSVRLDEVNISCNDLNILSLAYAGIKFVDTAFVLGGINTAKWTLYGNLTSISTVTWNNMREILLEGTGTHTIVCNQTLRKLTFNNGSGNWMLTDDLVATTLYLDHGNLYTNNYTISGSYFANTNGGSAFTDRKIFLGQSPVNYMEFYVPHGATVDADSATFNTHLLSTDNVVCHNVNITYNPNSTFSPGIFSDVSVFDTIKANRSCYISANNLTAKCVKLDSGGIFSAISNHVGRMAVGKDVIVQTDLWVDTLYLNNRGYSLSISNGKTVQVISEVFSNSGCNSGYILLKPDGSGIAYLKKTSGNLVLNDVVVENLWATGGATFNAYNSFALGSVQGFAFSTPAPRHLYWVGGSGNWTNMNKWSVTSGGAGGQCIPTPIDTVHFDNNSSLSGALVTQDASVAFCGTMIWNHSSIPKVNFSTAPASALMITESLKLDSSMMMSYPGKIIMCGTGDHSINTSGNSISGLFSLDNNGGRWDLDSRLDASNISFSNGVLHTNDHPIICSGASLDMDSIYFGKTYFKAANAGGLGWWDSDSATFEWAACNLYKRKLYCLKVLQPSKLDSCTIEKAEFGAPGPGYYQLYNSNNNTIGKATFYSDCEVSGSNSFRNVDFHGNVTVLGANTFDTLNLNNPGKIVTLPAGITQTINHELTVNSANNYLTALQSATLGSQAYISKAADTVCADYLVIKDINAGGGALFYAGMNSSDNGNNTGWSFSSCTLPYSDVWPGDANSDQIVDIYDALYVGLAYNESGYVRPGGNNAFAAQPSLDWNRVFLNQVNIKHADCNGNGTIDSLDLSAITLNYGQAHPLLPQPIITNNSVNPDLYLVPNQFAYNPGDSALVDIYLGNSSSPITDIYGLAFTFSYENSLVNNNSKMTYYNSWLTSTSNRVHLEKNVYSSSHIDVGLSRKDLTNASGQGKIGTFRCKLKTGVSGYLHFNFSGVKGISADESVIPLTTNTDSVLIATVGIDQVFASTIRLVPTVTRDKIKIFGASENKINKIAITDISGRTISEIEITNEIETEIDLSSLSPALYFINCNTVWGHKVFKIIKY